MPERTLDALVRVRAVAVNRLDVWVRDNAGHAYTVKLPLIPGYDVTGAVVALGPHAAGTRDRRVPVRPLRLLVRPVRVLP